MNGVDDYGVNALDIAAYCGYDMMVRYLVEGCWDRRSVDRYGLDGVHFWNTRRRLECCRMSY